LEGSRFLETSTEENVCRWFRIMPEVANKIAKKAITTPGHLCSFLKILMDFFNI
jgi:hypothetical protein